MTVFYRKYRPQKIAELDSETIRKKIVAVLTSKRLPHAFLLTGPRGLGKTSTARIIAKSVNCLNRKAEGEPCNECEMCISITNGSNLDVMEMDAASNRGIDEIRDLREKIKLAPTRAKYKVYIIDEVHMLTNEAFNALLKTLEEPPEHALFVLATTEPQKLPETIISRCMRFEFNFPTEKEIIESLKRVKSGEKLEIEDEAYLLIAKYARGSFRDAQKILDQLSLEGKKITRQTVEENFGNTQEKNYDPFVIELRNKNVKGLLEWLNNLIKEGIDLKFINEILLEYFHETLLFKAAGIVSKEENKKIVALLNVLTEEDLKKLIFLFNRAYQELKTAVIPQLPIEMAIIEWGENKAKSVELKVQSQVKSGKPEKEGESESISLSPKLITEVKAKNEEAVPISEKQTINKAGIQSDDLAQIWPKILEAVKPINHSVVALLRGAKPQSYDGTCLTIEVFYKFHKERLEEPKIFELLSDTISQLFGKSTKVKCVLGHKEKEDIVKAAEEIFGS